MPKKTWRTQYGPLEIVFENAWRFSGKSRESLTVNGIVVSERTTDGSETLKHLVTASHDVFVDAQGETYVVSAVAGTKWPGIFIGCQLFVNGILVGGDTRSKLMLIDPNKDPT